MVKSPTNSPPSNMFPKTKLRVSLNIGIMTNRTNRTTTR